MTYLINNYSSRTRTCSFKIGQGIEKVNEINYTLINTVFAALVLIIACRHPERKKKLVNCKVSNTNAEDKNVRVHMRAIACDCLYARMYYMHVRYVTEFQE